MEEREQTELEQETLNIPTTVEKLVEALIFAASEPLTAKQIKTIYEEGGEDEERHIEQNEIQHIVESLNGEYEKQGKGYRIVAIAGGYQFATLKEYAGWIGRLYKEQSRRKLSQSSLECLAIIAYRQPISKPEIESIRGVNCDYVMKTLLEKELVTIVGRAQTVGRPLLYGTTREFLKHFGLNEVTDLPRPREIEEILGESQFETERRMLEAQAGAEQMKEEVEEFKSRLPHIPKKKSEMDDSVQILPKERTKRINIRTKKEDVEEPGTAGVDGSGPTSSPAQDGVEEETGRSASTELKEIAGRVSGRQPEVRTDIDVPAEQDGSAAGSTTDTSVLSADTTRETSKEESAVNGGEMKEDVDLQQVADVQEEQKDLSLTGTIDRSASTDQTESGVVNIESQEDLPKTSNDQEPEVTQPRRTRWTAWKEKIQVFIKKLFG